MSTELVYFSTVVISFLALFVILYYVNLQFYDTIFLTLVVVSSISRWLLSFNNFFNLNYSTPVFVFIQAIDAVVTIFILYAVISTFSKLLTKRRARRNIKK